jgi:hypothetical protein
VLRKPDIVPATPAPEPGQVDEIDHSTPSFSLPDPGRERLHGRFDGIPPQVSTQRNIANRRRVIE